MNNKIEEIEDQKLELVINGELKECDLLFTYDGENVDMPIIGYTDNTKNDKGELNIMVSKYDPLFGYDTLEAVTDPKELELVNKIIADIQNEFGPKEV